MGTTRVREHLSAQGWTGEILEFAESSATVELAADKVGTEPGRIAKTLGFTDPADASRAIMVVVAGDARVHGGQFKRAFGAKPRMLQGDEVLALTGYPIGGVCPFAPAEHARVFLDESLRRFPTVFPAAGTATSAVEIAVDALAHLAGAEGWVDVSRGWQPAEPGTEAPEAITPRRAAPDQSPTATPRDRN